MGRLFVNVLVMRVLRMNDLFIKRTYKRIITSVTSYEIVLLLIRLQLVSILSWNPIQLIRWNLQLGLI